MTEKQLENFRANVRQLMAAEGISQRQLSEDIGLDRSSISRMLTGEREPTLEFVLAVSNRFNRKVDDLIKKSLLKGA